jgi:fructokinase
MKVPASASSLRCGIDLGGTKTEAVVLADSGEVIWRERRPTASHSYSKLIADLTSLIAQARSVAGGALSIGVGHPGAVNARSGLIKNANSTVLNGRNFKADLEAALGQPVRLENDANCFAISEARDGAGAGSGIVLGLILGTGVGAGIVVHGRVIRGLHCVGGEWGHNPLEMENAAAWRCYCGRTNCVETFLSGPGWLARERDAGSPFTSTQEIVAAAQAHHPAAIQSLERYVQALAKALAAVLNVLDPDVVVLGGGMGQIPDLGARVGQRLPRWFFSDECHTPILLPRHGDSSGVRGAAWLWELD